MTDLALMFLVCVALVAVCFRGNEIPEDDDDG